MGGSTIRALGERPADFLNFVDQVMFDWLTIWHCRSPSVEVRYVWQLPGCVAGSSNTPWATWHDIVGGMDISHHELIAGPCSTTAIFFGWRGSISSAIYKFWRATWQTFFRRQLFRARHSLVLQRMFYRCPKSSCRPSPFFSAGVHQFRQPYFVGRREKLFSAPFSSASFTSRPMKQNWSTKFKKIQLQLPPIFYSACNTTGYIVSMK